jgi:Spy/CpxP family protein refolding chaperone
MQRLSLLVLVVALGFTLACDNGEMAGTNNLDTTGFSGGEFAVVGVEDAYANIEDATLTEMMAMRPPVTDDGGFQRHQRHPGQTGSHLGPILRRLELTEAQREVMRAIVRDHRMQIRPILEQLRLANQDLIDRANHERSRIIESVRNGEISEEQARRLLHEISENTRRAIRNNPENERHLAALCDAKRMLFDDIRSALDDRQRVAWDEWVSGLSGACLGE